MPTSRQAPFRNFTVENWLNLAIAALLLFYAAQFVLDLAWGNMFGNLGVDFASFWGAGYIANHHGYAAVYDVDLMGVIQKQLLPARAAGVENLGVIPTPYLPIFLLPFQALALLPPTMAAWLWIIFNLVGTSLYLRAFARRLPGDRLPAATVLLLAVSAPVFLNTFIGQANLLLMVCAGEFAIAVLAGKRFVAGLWLAGLLLKPQTLVLIIPAILSQRWFRTAAGIVLGGLLALAGSWLLAGMHGLDQLAHLWRGYATGLPTNDVQLMMNWRMLGTFIGTVVSPMVAAGIVVLGMLVTAVVALILWTRPLSRSSLGFAVAALGLFSAACLFSWHAHVHMAMMVIPLLLLVAALEPHTAPGLVRWWVLFPAALYVARILLASILRLTAHPPASYALLDFMAGIGLFSMNLVLLCWAAVRARHPEPADLPT